MLLSEITSLLPILYEDNHIVVVVKPRNIPSQEDKTGDLDMLSILKDYLKQKYQKPGNVYLGLVHRLDRPTGGVMVFAKTDKAAARLSEQIRAGEVQKKYFALAVGAPREKQGRLTHYLTKDERNNMVKAHVAAVKDSKIAVLDYKVLDFTQDLSLIDVDLITGRSHQARVQLAALGTPIYGDHRYGAQASLATKNEKRKTKNGGLNQITNYKLQITNVDERTERLIKTEFPIYQKTDSPPPIPHPPSPKHLALWAYMLTFTHPVTKKTMVFKAFPPDETPWTLFSFEKFMNIAKPSD
ncbi:MAG: RNA pseudouridine synthase [Firmicutes bacterium]|nr:RNA pseudouridine synthase [Bacillota bacterium]